MKLNITCHSRQFLFDTISPTSAYLAVRNLFPGSVLLESTEFSSSREGKSIIGFDLISRLSVKENAMRILFPGKPEILTPIHDEFPLNCVSNYLESFKTINSDGVTNGFFVFHSFETFAAYESPDAGLNRFSDPHIPLLEYRLFRYVLTFNHYNGKAVLVQNCLSGEEPDLDSVCTTIFSEKGSDFPVFVSSEEQPDCLKEEFLEKVKTCQQMIRKGEIFQAVISRGFSRKFRGDDFRLYRALRVVNPSPYMFYFDFDSFKIFGSSPEAQIRVDGREATLRPIAGTIARTHNAETDTLLEKGLLSDPKENAEHAMLVDLARNDLNRNCRNVSVKELKKVVRFSHVSHLESEVAGTIPGSMNGINIFLDTFPAGTLSGAPKIRAVQIINELEGKPRGYFGGSIGYLSFSGELNLAIIIRSFYSNMGVLNYRAGAGIVLDSKPEAEFQEIENKISALRKAIEMTQNQKLHYEKSFVD